MSAAAIIGIVLGALSLLGTGASAYSNWRSTQSTNELQQTLAGQANQWQRENRDYENWYNSPAGLQSRGLNPALAMSAGGASLAQSASAGTANLPSDLKAPQLPDFGQSIAGAAQTGFNAYLAEQQANNLQSQTDLNNAETARKTGLLPYEVQEKQTNIAVAQSVQQLNVQKVRESLSSIGVNEATINNLEQQTYQFKLDNQYAESTINARISQMLNQEFITSVEADYAERLTLQKISESKSLIENYRASAKQALADANLSSDRKSLLESQVKQLDAAVEQMEELKKGITEDNAIKAKEREIIEKTGEERAKEEIKRIRAQRVTDYISAGSDAVRTATDCVQTFYSMGKTAKLPKSSKKPMYEYSSFFEK